jgi:hypothetical protein
LFREGEKRLDMGQKYGSRKKKDKFKMGQKMGRKMGQSDGSKDKEKHQDGSKRWVKKMGPQTKRKVKMGQ